MKTTIEFLDDLAAKLGGPNDPASDYAVSKALEIERATVSRWRSGKGTMGEDIAVQVAELLGEDPKFVLSCVLAERSSGKKAKQVLRQIADSFKGAAVIAIAFGAGILGIFTPAPARTTEVSAPQMYIMSYNRIRAAPV